MPRDSRVQKAMNAISESITAVFSCVTDIISLILLNCFGISCVNEHNGTGEEKKKRLIQTVSRNCSFWWVLGHLLRRWAWLAVNFRLEQIFWIYHAKDPTWNSSYTSTEDRPHPANTYHLNSNCFHIEIMTLKQVHGHSTWTSEGSYSHTMELPYRQEHNYSRMEFEWCWLDVQVLGQGLCDSRHTFFALVYPLVK